MCIFPSDTLLYVARAKRIIAKPREVLGKEWVRDQGNDLRKDRLGKQEKSAGLETVLWRHVSLFLPTLTSSLCFRPLLLLSVDICFPNNVLVWKHISIALGKYYIHLLSGNRTIYTEPPLF